MEILFSLQWYVETYFAGSDTILVFKFFRDVFGGGTRLAMPKTVLRAGLIVIEAWFLSEFCVRVEIMFGFL